MVRSTTVVSVRRDGEVAVGGDGQVTLNDAAIKHQARKVRRLYDGKVIVGFAGATADAFSLLERFEEKLKTYQGHILKSATELAKEWRSDRVLRRLECLLVAVDREVSVLISGSGDVIAPDDGVLAVGSGGQYAAAAAKALVQHTSLSAEQIVEESLKIAASICVYTNDEIQVEVLK